MKRMYVTPVMECENFVANEYVAACLTYKVLCQTPGNNEIPYHYLYDDSNKDGVLDINSDNCIINMNDYIKIIPGASFHGCGKEHTVTFTEKPKVNGWVIEGTHIKDGNDITVGYTPNISTAKPVFWWYGDIQTGAVDGTNVGEHMIDINATGTYSSNAS